MKEGFGRLLPLSDALSLLLEEVKPLEEKEEVDIDEALGRVTAEEIFARVDVPHFDRAAMDGYAVKAADTFTASRENPVELTVLGTIETGYVPELEVRSGGCARISTGGAVPKGADAVVMVEHVEQRGEKILLFNPVAPGTNIVRAGSDIKAGAPVVRPHIVLYPEQIGALAACGLSKLPVLRRPIVGVISTGPELLDVGDEPKAGCVYDINSHTLSSALRVFGCEPLVLGRVPDKLTPLTDAILTAVDECDLLLLSGGSSLGQGDLVPQVLSNIGRLLFHGIAVKPGKPTAAGIVKHNLVIGLPGYPTSALSNFYILVLPVIERILGVRFRRHIIKAKLAQKVFSTVGRYEFLPVRLDGEEAHPVIRGSSAITSLSHSDGFVEIDENTEVLPAGTDVQVTLFPRGLV